jgi:serine/threonine-protein kinase
MGKYDVVEHIATGGMGMVFRARDVESDRPVALKVLTKEMAAKQAMLVRFQREAKSAMKLHHENIVSTYEIGEINGNFFLAMEFIDGTDLHDYTKQKGTLDPEEARQIILQGARALRHAGEQNIVHRDVKPSNFLLVKRGGGRPLVKLTDFGLAREVDADEFRVTRAGTTVGTIDYMAPEQARDSSAADHRSDLYSLGSTWYHLLTGHAPFPQGGLGERLIKILSEEPPDARALNPRVSDETWFVLARLLAKDPAERYQTAGELIDDLQELEGRAVRKKGAPHPVAPRARKKSGAGGDTSAEFAAATKVSEPKAMTRWYAGIAAALLLVGVVVVVASVQNSSPKGPPPETSAPADGNPGLLAPAARAAAPPEQGAPKAVETPAAPAKPAGPRWPALYKPAEAFDPAALRAEVEAPWKGRAAAGEPFTARVARLPAAAAAGVPAFRSLAEACAAAPPGRPVVLEVHDNGPLFELPAALAGRDLTVRAGKGYRPLIVWDLPATVQERKRQKKAAEPLVFLGVQKGGLTLEGLELAWRWPEGLAEPGVVVDVQDGSVDLRDCTLSGAGRPGGGAGVSLVRLKGARARCRLTRCHARGAAVTALDLDGPADVLLDGCLLVGGRPPLLRVRSTPADGPRLRVVRSTLVCGQTLLALRPAEEGDRNPALSWLGWDSLVSRSGAAEGGELLSIAGRESDADGVEWRAVNCLYAGWKTLLASGKQRLEGDYRGDACDDARAWQRLWKRTEGEGALRDAWPAQVFNEPAILPAAGYRPGKAVGFAAFAAPDGPLGCDLAALPPARDAWVVLALDPVLAPPDPPAASAPEVPDPGDGRYHGERLDLTEIDLGAHLAEVQKARKLGPRVVLHLAGAGERPTRPVRLKGATLVLYFEEPARDAPPLVLKLARTSPGGPFLQVDGGGLEVIGGVLRVADAASTRVSHMIQVKGGDIKLARTRVEGPQQSAPAGYQSAVVLAGSGDANPEKAHSCALNESVVFSSRAGVVLDGVGCRLLVRQSVVLAGGEALALLPGPGCKGKAGMQVVLENATLAGRTATVRLGDCPAAAWVAEPVVVQARDSAYLNPFPGRASKGGLLLAEGDALARGLLVWQGEREGFDHRLFFAAARAGAPPEKKEGPGPWRRLWGSAGARAPWPELKWLPELSPRRWSLERLVLPVRGPLGANLKELGVKKKG